MASAAVPEAPLTARARKAAQAINAQGKQSVSPAGKPVTAKNQPKSKQRQAPANNGAGKTGALPINSNGASKAGAPASGKAGAPASGKAGTPASGKAGAAPKGQAPAPKKRWQTQRQKKTRAPGAASTDQATGKTPSQGAAAPQQKKQPVSV